MREGKCVTIPDNRYSPRMEGVMDDNDIVGTCLICGGWLAYEKTKIDPNSEYFKWAITGKANQELYEKYKKNITKGGK